jgi:hypothetical protein
MIQLMVEDEDLFLSLPISSTMKLDQFTTMVKASLQFDNFKFKFDAAVYAESTAPDPAPPQSRRNWHTPSILGLTRI